MRRFVEGGRIAVRNRHRDDASYWNLGQYFLAGLQDKILALFSQLWSVCGEKAAPTQTDEDMGHEDWSKAKADGG